MYRHKNTISFFYGNVSLLKLAVKVQSGKKFLCLKYSEWLLIQLIFAWVTRAVKLNREDEATQVVKGI